MPPASIATELNQEEKEFSKDDKSVLLLSEVATAAPTAEDREGAKRDPVTESGVEKAATAITIEATTAATEQRSTAAGGGNGKTGVLLEPPPAQVTTVSAALPKRLEPIKLYVLPEAQRGVVADVVTYDAEIVDELRSVYHIVAQGVGTLQNNSTQNVFLAAPYALMPEQAALLVEKGIAVLMDGTRQPVPPARTQAQKDQAADERHSVVLSQAAHIYRSREDDRKRHEAASEFTRAKRAKTHEESAATAASFSKPLVLPFPPEKTSLTATSTGGENPYQRHVPSARVVVPTMASNSYLSRDKPSHFWEYPRQDKRSEMDRYAVFRDLWEKGYYMTSGAKFGGDFLAYPGDPHRYHSHYVVVIVPMDAILSPYDVVSMGRLGTVVKKAPLVSSVRKDGSVAYLSLEWTGAN